MKLIFYMDHKTLGYRKKIKEGKKELYMELTLPMNHAPMHDSCNNTVI